MLIENIPLVILSSGTCPSQDSLRKSSIHYNSTLKFTYIGTSIMNGMRTDLWRKFRQEEIPHISVFSELWVSCAPKHNLPCGMCGILLGFLKNMLTNSPAWFTYIYFIFIKGKCFQETYYSRIPLFCQNRSSSART